MTTLFGIKNCDTVKKARKWLEQNHKPYEFHDFRTDGLSESTLSKWLQRIGGDRLINRRSSTWKQLSQTDQKKFDGDTISKAAIDIVLKNPTLIKRPVMQDGASILVGFKDLEYQEFFN